MAQPLMPHATAAWLVENTSLTFEQIAEFCGLHILEVQAIADDTAATKLTGRDPVRAGELTHEEIEKGQSDSDYAPADAQGAGPGSPHQGTALHAGRRSGRTSRTELPGSSRTIPEVSDGQISKLIGTTRTTIAAIRDRTHWNMANITPKDPVTLGLTTQRELDASIVKAQKAAGGAAPTDETLRERPRRPDRAASRRARAACARRRGRSCCCGGRRRRRLGRNRPGHPRPVPSLISRCRRRHSSAMDVPEQQKAN